MKRLFIAIELPEEAKLFIRDMGRSIPRAKTVPPEQLHFTLKFIGEVESSMVLDIEETLSELVHPCFQLQVKGVGIFPPRSTARVLWAGITPHGQVTKLRNKINNQLFSLGVPKEKKKFIPHVTLARLKNSPVPALQSFLTANAFLETAPFTVNNYSLFESKLTPNGAIHTQRSSFSLY